MTACHRTTSPWPDARSSSTSNRLLTEVRGARARGEVSPVDVTVAVLLIRLIVGVTIIAHGVNHWGGGGGIAGTAGWFSGPGLRLRTLQARLPAVTETGAGSLLTFGRCTSVPCRAVISVMLTFAFGVRSIAIGGLPPSPKGTVCVKAEAIQAGTRSPLRNSSVAASRSTGTDAATSALALNAHAALLSR
ncbi:DoxX family protein [Amycolatopsis sp. K13G38]|uniref:DoxX family protein n=1 Tax=Amycolatopsis acididurans TaxID=2724524 RepID=A0ABX1J806_9PSEU|nr:DoxX family protein [Amycolatopsis acididurans]